MTSLCAGAGTSSPKAGVSPAITLTATAIDAFLSAIIDPIAAQVIAGVVAASLTIDATSYCSTDPPADPGLTPADMLNVLATTDPSVNIPAIQKVEQWFLSQYWYQICQCDAGAQPTAPSPSNPGPVSQDPGLPTQSATACWSVQVPYTVPAWSGSGPDPIITLNGAGLPPGDDLAVTFGGAFTPSTGTAVAVVPGASKLKMSAQNDQVVSSGKTLTIGLTTWTSTGTKTTDGLSLQYLSTGPAGFNKYTNDAPLLSTTKFWDIDVSNSDTIQHTGSVTFSFFCPPGTNLGPSCCPPDPLLEGLLRQILALDTAIYSLIPARVPNYAASPATTGLTGHGSLSLASTTIALQVVVTSLPVAYGLVPGAPDTYLDIGWITPVTNEGPESGLRLTRTTQVFALPEATSSVDYSLPPGEVISIAQLQAG